MYYSLHSATNEEQRHMSLTDLQNSKVITEEKVNDEIAEGDMDQTLDSKNYIYDMRI